MVFVWLNKCNNKIINKQNNNKFFINFKIINFVRGKI